MPSRLARLRLGFRTAAVVLGLLQGWASRNAMNPDGMSYLDIADAYMRGDWANAINAYWSPLYSWIVGVALRLLDPSPSWEFAAVHAVNFALYLAALVSFEFFARELLLLRQSRSPDPNAGESGDGEWPLLVAAYSLFLWSSIWLIGVGAVTPDMCLAVVVYVALGLLLRVRSGRAKRLTLVALGATLGLGYLAKAAMFPLALVFLAMVGLATRPRRRAAANVAVALLAFAAVAAPFVVAISRAKGRFTFGESRTIVHLWFVNQVAPYDVHWQGEPPGSGVPVHPTRRLLAEPPVYEFASPIVGSYPPWYDPSYWFEGVRPPLALRRQLVLAGSHALVYAAWLAPFLGAWLVLALTGRVRELALRLWEYRCALLPSLAAFGLYALVLIEKRYVGPFAAPLCLALLCAALDAAGPPARLTRSVTLAISVVSLVPVAALTAGYASATARELLDRSPPRHVQWEVAEGLRQLGVRPGDRVAVIGYGYLAFWARLARVRVVAELPGDAAPRFWTAPPPQQRRVLDAFASTGARVVVTEGVPAAAAAEWGWRPLGRSGFFALTLGR